MSVRHIHQEAREPSRIGGRALKNAPISEGRAAPMPRYGGVAKALHWVILLLLVARYAIAWTMPGIHRGTWPEGLINVHLSLGLVILALAALRLLWRVAHPVPLPGTICRHGNTVWRRSSMRCSTSCLSSCR